MKNKNTMNGSNKQILYFRADWCQPCKMVGPVVDKLKEEGYNIKKIDIEVDRDSVDKYGVMSIPTFILVENDKEVERFTGVQTETKLKNLLRE